MNTTDGMWVPSYYRRRHPFLWLRAAGGPKRIDLVVGVGLAVLVFGFIVHTNTLQRQTVPTAAATTASEGSDVTSDRVAFVPQVSAVSK